MFSEFLITLALPWASSQNHNLRRSAQSGTQHSGWHFWVRQDYTGCPTNTLFICPSLTSLFSLRRTLLARAPFGTHHHLQLPSHQASLLNSQLVGVQLIFPNSKKSLILFLSTVFFQISPVRQEKLSCTLAGPTRPALLEGEDPMKALARPRSRAGPIWGLNPGNSPFNTVFQTVLLQCILTSI